MADPKSPHRLQAVVFDLDGLIFNTEVLYEQVGQELLRRRGQQITADLLDEMMGRKASAALQLMIDRHRLSDTVEALAEETDEIFKVLLETRLETMPGVFQLLDALERAELPKGIATSSRRAFARGMLGRFELEPRFQFVLAAEDIEHGKPHPEIYLRAAAHFGLNPHEVLVLEDSAIGCQSAVAAGTFTVAVPHSRSFRHDFTGTRLIAETLCDRRIYEALGVEPP